MEVKYIYDMYLRLVTGHLTIYFRYNKCYINIEIR